MLERKYKIRERTPKENMCIVGTCPAIYEVEEITPKKDMCIATACPGVYEVEERTPKEEMCLVGTCPAIKECGENYLIIGKKAEPSDFGLEGKVGKDEVLIEIPKGIIDNRRK